MRPQSHVTVSVRRTELIDHSPVRRFLRVSAAAEVMNNPPALVAGPVALRDAAHHHRHVCSLALFKVVNVFPIFSFFWRQRGKKGLCRWGGGWCLPQEAAARTLLPLFSRQQVVVVGRYHMVDLFACSAMIFFKDVVVEVETPQAVLV